MLLVHLALSYQNMRPLPTSVPGLQQLVYEALSYQQRSQRTVCYLFKGMRNTCPESGRTRIAFPAYSRTRVVKMFHQEVADVASKLPIQGHVKHILLNTYS